MGRQLTGILLAGVAMVLLGAMLAPAQAARIKDLASIDGVRDNQLMGFGLVGGLAGTGDDPKSAPYTAEAIANMLGTFGFEMDPQTISVNNFAAVMVTCNLPPYVKNGDQLDITVSSIGSADSLEGGQLYQTLMKAADGEVYAVAQGAVSLSETIGGDGGGGGRNNKMTTVGRIPQGAIVERTVPSTVLKDDNKLRLNLHNPDFTTANSIVEAINAVVGAPVAEAEDAATISVFVPEEYQRNLVPYIAVLEGIQAIPDTDAKVVINERTGTIVVGNDVTILPCAVTHGQMTLTFGEQVEAPGAEGEETAETTGLREPTTAEEVAIGLNKMNLAPADIVAIFQAIAASDALLGKLEIL